MGTDEYQTGSRDQGWVEAVIEIPRGSRNKYEYDQQRGIFRLDRVLYSSMHYPTDYGFLPETLSLDGDSLNVLVVAEEPTFPGCHLRVRPIEILTMLIPHGEDGKILAVRSPIRASSPSRIYPTWRSIGRWKLRRSFAATKSCRACKRRSMTGRMLKQPGPSLRGAASVLCSTRVSHEMIMSNLAM
jgi:hypothetical protein